MDNSALTPDNFILDAEPIKEQESVAIEIATEADKEVASLLQHRGFARIAADMKRDIDKLKSLTHVDMTGLDVAEVGQRFLVASLTADKLQTYLDRVENAAKAVADAERAKDPK